MEFDELSGRVIGCAIEVHRNLGPGLLESVYRQCMAFELRSKGLNCETEKSVRVTYKQLALDSDLRIDLLIENSLVVELKSVENLLPLHEAQLLTYMKMASARTGLLINFNTRFVRDGIRRFVL